MAQRLNKQLVVGLTVAGMVLITGAGILLVYSLPGRDPKLMVTEAEKLAQQKEFETASKYYAKAAARAMSAGNPADANNYMVKSGEMWLQAGEQFQALKAWGTVMLNNPQHEGAQQKIVELKMEQAQLYGQQLWRDVQKDAEKLCQITQNANVEGVHALGRSLIEVTDAKQEDKQQELEKGRDLLKEAVKREPTNPYFTESLARCHLRLFQQMVTDAQLKGSRDPAALEPERDKALAQAGEQYDELMKAIEKNPPKDPAVITIALRKRGQFHLSARDGVQTEYQGKRVQRVSLGELEVILARLKKHAEQALDSLGKALKNSPSDQESLVLMAAYYRSTLSLSPDATVQKQEDEANEAKAKELYKQAIQADADSFDAYLQLADIYSRNAETAFAQQNHDEGQASLAKADQVLEQRIVRGTPRAGVSEWRNRAYMGHTRWQAFQVNSLRIERLRYRPGGPTESETKQIMARLTQVRKDFVADTHTGDKDPRAMFMKARIEMFEKNPFAAITTLSSLQDRVEPGDLWVRTRLHLAELCLQTDSPGPAVTAMQDVVRVYPGMESAMGMLARALATLPDRQGEAEDAAKRTLAINPSSRDALVALGTLAEKQKNWAEVKRINDILSGGQNLTAKGKVQQASLLVAQSMDPENKDPELIRNAQAILAAVLKEDSANFEALRVLAMSVPPADEAKHKEVIALIDKAKAAMDGKLKMATASTKPSEQETKTLKMQRANLDMLGLFAQPNLSEAERIKQSEAVIRQADDPFMIEVDLYRLYLGSKTRQLEAAKHLKEAYRMKPDEPQVAEMLFRVAISGFKDEKGQETLKPDWELASQLVKKLTDLRVDPSGGHHYQGQLLFAKGDHVQAEKEFREALKIFPKHSAGYAWLGRTLATLQRVNEAESAFQQAFILNPRNGMAAMYLAVLADNKQDQQTKEKYLKICKDLNFTNDWVAEQLQILQDKQDPAKGIARREELRKQNPKDLVNLRQLALLYAQKGDKAKAKELMGTCFEANPKDLRFLQEYTTFLRDLKPPDCELAEKVIRKTMESFGPNEKLEKATSQLSLAAHLEIVARLKLSNATKPDTLEAATVEAAAVEAAYVPVEAAYVASSGISDHPAIMLDIAAYYARRNDAAKTEDWMRKSIASAVGTKDAKREQIARQQLVQVLLRVRDPKRASDILKEIDQYRAKFSDPAGLSFLSEYAIMVGRESKAIDYTTQLIAAASGQDKALAFFRRGSMNYRRGEWDLTINDLREAKALAPNGFDYEHRILLARCLQITGQTDQAETELSSVLSENPRTLQAAEELYQIYMASKQYDQAEAFIMPAYQKEPNSPRWAGLLSEIATDRGDYNKAIEWAILTAKNAEFSPRLVDGLLSVYLQFKRYDDLIAFVANTLPEAKRNEAYVQLRLSAAYYAKGQKAPASEAFGRALKLATANPGPILSATTNLTKCMGKESTLAFVTEQSSSYPNDPVASLALALVYRDLNDSKAFFKVADSLLPKLPKGDKNLLPLRIELMQSIGGLQYQAKQFEQARKSYEEVLEIAPEGGRIRPVIMNNLAYLLAEGLNQPAAGLKYAEQANALITSQTNVLDTLGWCLVLTGDFDRGVSMIRAAAYMAGSLELSQMAAIHYHASVGLLRRAQLLQTRNQATEADQDMTEAKLACRRSHQLLVMANQSDARAGRQQDEVGLSPKIVSVAKQLDLKLETGAPAALAPVK